MAKSQSELPPPRWDDQQLENDRQAALEAFVSSRGQEGTRVYESIFKVQLKEVERVFASTDNLLAFSGEAFELQPDLLNPARYLAAPPVSADDLDTLAGSRIANRRRLDALLAQRAADILRAAWDPIRFPWIKTGRNPRPPERRAALNWTAGILAIEKTKTARRGESSQRQEAAVVAGLASLDLEQFQVKQVNDLDDLPRASFAKHPKLAGVECDLAVRMKGGRLLAIECKVSNSATNSIKRLIHEAGNKSARWRDRFGQRVIPAAVLSGVFTLTNLLDAQDSRDITIFWEHNLAPLFDFVRRS